MWFIISVMLHGMLLLGGIFHWKNYEVTAKESPVARVSMNFSVEKAEPAAESKTPITKEVEKKVEKKPEEKKLKKIKEAEKPKEKVAKKKPLEKAEKKKEADQNSLESLPKPGEAEKIQSPSMDGLVKISEGVYAAKNQGIEGLKYEILFQQDPEYPEIGKRLGYRKPVEVKVRFLVGYEGKIEEIKFYGEDIGMGFRGEVEKVLKKWRFSPVTLKEKKIKMYFYKAFIFNQI